MVQSVGFLITDSQEDLKQYKENKASLNETHLHMGERRGLHNVG